jgi:cyanophycin synthetase
VVLQHDERGELIVIRDGPKRVMPVAWTSLLPVTFEGRARMNVQNALAVTAAAHAAGAHLHDIRQGLRNFNPSMYQSPGRLNLVEVGGIKVLLDYAHNPHGLATVGDFVERMTAPAGPGVTSWSANIRLAVVATPGDRRDDDIRELGRVAARYFDDIIIREDDNPRGRKKGETAALVMEGVQEAMRKGARAGNVEIVVEEPAAVRRALYRSRPGDLVVLCIDHPERVWRALDTLRTRQPGAAPTEGDGQPSEGISLLELDQLR